VRAKTNARAMTCCHTVSHSSLPLELIGDELQLLKSQVTTALKHLHIAQDTGDDNTTWNWIVSLLTTLGIDGMSSDESDVEGIQMVYCVCVHIYQRAEATKVMEMIDSVTLADWMRVGHMRGQPPRIQRRETDNPDSRQEAPKKMPRALYNNMWLSALTPQKVVALQVSKEAFKWLDIAME
jgi:hypothetical protein